MAAASPQPYKLPKITYGSGLKGSLKYQVAASSKRFSACRFKSHYFGEGTGFQLRYKSTDVVPTMTYRFGTCGAMFTTPYGILTSPSYPQKYQNYEDCFYTILQPNGTVIDITITSMDIEWHSTCYYDYLEIRDGGSEQSEVLTKLCGDEIPNPIQSTQNEVWIR